MNDALILAIGVSPFFQPTVGRCYSALSFVFLTLFHLVFFQTLDGIHYYGSAAMMDLVIMAMISKQKSALSVNLQLMCVVSITLNAIGWSMYHFYMPPDLYNAAYTLFYLFCAYILFRDLKVKNARDRQLDSGNNDFPASIDEGTSLV